MKKSLLLLIFIFVASSLFAQNNWKTITSIAGEMVQFKPGKILSNGQVIWLCGCKDVSPYKSWSYRSTDGGQTWLKSPDINDARTAGIDAKDANTAIMGLSTGKIIRTTDGGATWNEVHSYTASDPWFDFVYFIDNNNVIGLGDGDAAGQYYICKSTDGGSTFTQTPYANLPSAGTAQYGYFSYGTCTDKVGNTIWLALYESSSKPSCFIKTTDAGVTWKAISITTPSVRIRGFSFSDQNNGMCVDNSFKVFKTTDGGTTWSAVTLPKTDVNGTITIRGVSGVKGTNKMLLLGHIEGTGLNKMPACWSTTDMGATWVKDNVPIAVAVTGSTYLYLSSAVMKDSTTGFLLGADGVVYQTGIPTISKNLNLVTEIQFGGKLLNGLLCKPGKILDNGNTIWLCGHDPRTSTPRDTYTFLSTDGGKTFKQGTLVSGRTTGIEPYDKTTALMGTADGKIVKTTDGGTTWKTVHTYTLSGGSGFFDGLKIINDSVVIAFGDGENGGDLYFCKSTNKGETFTVIPQTGLAPYGANLYGYFAYGACMSSYGDNVWCATYGGSGTNGWILKSTDAGVTWTSLELTMANRRFLSISFANAKDGMGVDNVNDIFVTTNGGNTWTKVATKPAASGGTTTIYCPVGVPNTRLFLVNGVNVNGSNNTSASFYTTDLGTTWTQILAPPTASGAQSFSGIFLNEQIGYVFTNGGYLLKLGTGTPTSVESPFVSVPKGFVLDQNYPNPFNPSTTIRFNITQSENVKLTVYDALGREISTLVNDKLSAGQYEYKFNAANHSSGIYYYTLSVGNNVETKKMMFIK